MLLRRINVFVFILALPLLIVSCSKGSGDTPQTPSEENLVISIDPDPGSAIAKALGANYDFKLKINSKMPDQGIEGTVQFRKEADNSLISSQNISSTTTPINIIISNIALNEVGVVTVTIKSKTKPGNTASKSFKLARK